MERMPLLASSEPKPRLGGVAVPDEGQVGRGSPKVAHLLDQLGIALRQLLVDPARLRARGVLRGSPFGTLAKLEILSRIHFTDRPNNLIRQAFTAKHSTLP